MESNPYQAPESEFQPATIPVAIGEEGIEERALRVFVGKKADYYLRKWQSRLRNPSAGAGFNWWAFLFAGIWLPYRKMYQITFIFFGIIVTESVAEAVLPAIGIGQPDGLALLGNLISFVISCIVGFKANAWYLSHAQNVIAQTPPEGRDGHVYLDALARRGGTSMGAALGLFLLFVIIVAGIAEFIPPLLSGNGNPVAGP